ncbi:gliding motility-associated C-terminal domain-containing protein [Marinoscillum sp. MHG1-6]|uniref:gliding motility-associated C-terminal domain-containing protein n=1 Tax=Marinoscillum sp. MHG1-6 TaxID=2959627 RepID=UPI0021582912|nr:gliding motility-associated C-terminal domain-containing protein [Marinoscillum sp. MHG1-6]
MRNRYVRRILTEIGKVAFLFLLFFSFRSLQATHIRAGEITAVRINQFSLTYRFTITGYRDSGSSIEFGGGTLKLGDGTIVDGPFDTQKVPAGNEIEMVSFTFVHTYESPNGNGYLVSYEEDYRNDGIINMDNSVGTPFYIESLIVIDPFFGINNTPVLTVPPIDYAAVGGLFIHNSGAYDPDGDSLSYRFTTPKQARGTTVNNYRELNDPEFYSDYSQGSEAGNPPTLSLNPITGDLIWDSPGDKSIPVGNNPEQREYNVAFIIEEWRQVQGQWFRLGYVVRDMQIIVLDTDNNRPEITAPDDICVTAGETVSAIATAIDPDGDPIKLEVFGGPFEVSNTATYAPDPPTYQENSPAVLNFSWDTQCSNVRERPYEVQIKATDLPEFRPNLVEFETFLITVAGPAPTGLQASVTGSRSITLNWDDYACSEAESMQIWRKTGSFDVTLDECELGMPANTGYELIDNVSINETTYLDNNAGSGLSAGAKYCYRLVAEFPAPGGGVSYVSEEICDSLIIDVPVITNVDVRETSETDGEIIIKWTPPYQINPVDFPPPYSYDLFRKSNESGSAYTKIVSKTADTSYVDTGLNTHSFQYTYYVGLYDGNDASLDSSSTASSVWLQLTPLVQSMELSWSAEVPWSMKTPEYPYHYIYRDRVIDTNLDSLVVIDSVDITFAPLKYVDNGAFNGETLHDTIEYCYYVSTQGTYENDLLPEPLINRSQVACGQPNDTIPPCTPLSFMIDPSFECEAYLADKGCDNDIFQNRITWEEDGDFDCDDDIVSYNIYYSETGDEGTFELKSTEVGTSYTDTDLTSFKGCYKLSSVDRSGNESELTEMICNDNCPFILFPNAFTPNKDGFNDVFTPIYTGRDINVSSFDYNNCPRFVLDLEFKVFDRTGNEVFQYSTKPNENDYLIRWDGTNKQGLDLAVGVYYYEAVVTFDVLDPKQAKKSFKGWIQLMR